MPLSQKAIEDVRAKLAGLQAEHGSLDQAGKCDDQYRIAYPDAVDLHEWRREWNRARAAEQSDDLDPTVLHVGLATGEPREGIDVPADGTTVELVAEERPRRRRKNGESPAE